MSDDGRVGIGTLWQDERGHYSSARALLWMVVLVTLGVIVGEALGRLHPSGAAWGILGSMILAFTSWAGGSRLAQYLAPTMSSVVESLAAKARPYGVSAERLDDGK